MRLPLAEQNVNTAALLKAHGISEDDLQKPHGEISLKKYLAFLEAAAHEANDPLLGIRLARSAGPETLGAIGFLFLSSRTLAEAINNLHVYLNLLQGATLSQFYQNTEEITYSYQFYDTRDLECRQDVEFSMALTSRLIRIYGGSDIEILAVGFRHSPVTAKSEYERLLKAPVHFEQETNSVSIPSRFGQLRGQVLDHGLSRILQDFLDEELEQRNLHQTFSDQVRRALLDGGVPPPITAAKVAQYFGLSDATFYRRLKAEGLTFGTLVNHRNFDMAKSYLKESSLSITAIAHMVGFSESASFTRAFTRWSAGETPSEYRKRINFKPSRRKR